MKFYRSIPLLITAAFCSCLMTAPVQKEAIRPAGFSEAVAGGELERRISLSLARLRTASRDVESLFRPDSNECVSLGVGNTLLGLVLMSRAAGEGTGLADALYKAIPSRLNPSGYLGEVHSGIADESQLAGHGLLVRALSEYYLWTGESSALDMAQVICDSLFVPLTDLISSYPLEEAQNVVYDHPGRDSLAVPPPVIDGWRLSGRGAGTVFWAVEGLARFYELRKSDRLKNTLDELVSLFRDAAGDPAGLSTAPFISGIKGLLRYGEAHSSTSLNNDAANAWETVRALSLTEFFGISPVIGDTLVRADPTAASEAYTLCMWLWSTSGKTDHLEDAERIFYNALMPAQTRDRGFALIYAEDSLGKLQLCGSDSCICTTGWEEALSSAVRYSYFVRDNKILIPFYSSGELNLRDKGVHVVQTTDYPAGRSVKLEIVDAPKRGINFQVHFPSYMIMKSMTLNGNRTVSGTVNSLGLLELRDVFRKGDVLEMNYSFTTKWAETSADKRLKDMYRAVSGPLVLGYHADTMVWFERGIALKDDNSGGAVPDGEFSYRRDTVSSMVHVLNAMGGENVAGTRSFDPPVYRPLYRPLTAGTPRDAFPEYVLTRIGKNPDTD